MIERTIKSKIEKILFKGKVIIIYGPRQVGKTTLGKEIISKFGKESRYFNCDILSVRQALETTNDQALINYIGKAKIIIFDEAQRIENIGLVLKIHSDTFPKLQIIATGSSSFELANKVSETLTGRVSQFILYPFSLNEISSDIGKLNLESSLEKILRFESYPKVFLSSEEEAKNELDGIAGNYLYKDILSLDKIKKSSILIDLLQLLALQLGGDISTNKIARQLKISSQTVDKYLDLLEKCFVTFKLRSFSCNLRNEIAKSFKIYFYDLGIRNTLIQNFNSMNIRDDVGGLWENFCIIERIKYNQAISKRVNSYFWRTYQNKEINYIEEFNCKLQTFEFKWNEGANLKLQKSSLQLILILLFKK